MRFKWVNLFSKQSSAGAFKSQNWFSRFFFFHLCCDNNEKKNEEQFLEWPQKENQNEIESDADGAINNAIYQYSWINYPINHNVILPALHQNSFAFPAK